MTIMNEKRRAQRANVRQRVKGVFLRCPELSAKDIRVANISEFGLGIETGGLSHVPERDETFDARLLVGYTTAPVRVKVVRQTGDLLGMEIVQPSELLRGAIRAFFQPELVGAAVRPSGEVRDPEKVKDVRLHYSDEENVMQAEFNDGQVRALTVGILGISIEWSEGEPLKMIQNEREKSPDDYLRKQLVKFVHNIDGLPESAKREISNILVTK